MSEQVLGLFDTPVIVEELADAPALNVALRTAIAGRRSADAGVSISNMGGWQSRRDMAAWGGPAAARLVERVMALADRHSVDVAAQGRPRHRWVPELWANVSPPGASNQVHTHPGAFWSAVYYVDDGCEAGREQGGELVLIDPRMPMVLMNMPNLRLRGAGGQIHEPQIALRPKTGRLILFPSWLEHGVNPYRGSRERVSIAINLMAIPLGLG